MSRSAVEYLRHILVGATYLLDRSAGLEKEVFLQDETLKRAFVRSLEIIGEAAKQVPQDFRQKHQQIDWRDLAGMRDRLIHRYFGVDYDIVWDAIKNKVPRLREDMRRLIEAKQDTDA